MLGRYHKKLVWIFSQTEAQGGDNYGRLSSTSKSQAKQSTPTPAAPVSTVKPAEYEKGAASSTTAGSAAKPAAAATAASTAPTSTAATASAGGSTGTKVSGGVSTGAASSLSTQGGSSKVSPKTPPTAPTVSTGSGAVGGIGGIGGTGATGAGAGAGKPTPDPFKPKDASKDKAQTTSISSPKPEPSKVTTIGVGGTAKKDDAKPKESKVQVEVPPPAAKASAPAPAVDPFDALAGSLPSSEPLAPKVQFTGPEVKESGLTSEKAKLCGEKDFTLPPGYRKEDMEKKVPAGVPEKPKEVAKPLTDDELLDSLSAGFVSSPAPSAPKSQASTVISSSKPEPSKVTSSGGAKPSAPANVSGSTAQKDDAKSKEAKVHAEVSPAAAKTSAPEKKVPAGKLEKPKEVPKPLTDDELMGSLGFGSPAVPSAPKAEVKAESAAVAKSSYAPPPPTQKRQEVTAPTSMSPAPPADKKAKVEKPAPSYQPSKPKTDEEDPMSLDAMSALADMLPAAKPVPESPKLRPEDIVNEKKEKSEKGVRVGEREDSLPPEYRFSNEKVKDKPAPPKEPSMDSGEALDILSGDFTSPSVAPAVKAPVPPSAPAKQQPKVEDLSALDALASDFVAPAQAKKVASGAPPAPPLGAKSTPGAIFDEGDPMSLDALSALEGTLPAAKPVPESPKLRPEDIVDEKKLTSEKGVFVGEREDSRPPDYRFSEKDLKKYPAPPKREPSLDSAAALDILSGGFTSPSVAPAVQTPVPPSAPFADSSADLALEELAGDFVAPTSASKVHSAVTAPPKADRQLSEGTASAMDALSDTLMDIGPIPEPKPVAPKDIVKEKTVKEEKVGKAGERDDSLPPDFRPTEADIKAAAEAKAKAPKQVSMDESAALDVLSSDFSTSSAAPMAPPPSHPHSTPAKTPQTHSASQASGPVLDKLASTLLPDLPEAKPKDSKPKVKGGKSKSKPKKPAVDDVPAVGNLSGKPSTDVVSSTPTKKGGKS
ncbi:calpastatin isoform X10 [Salminus brasiliensis]|uniref:calpastatin isoform X10 n=1 Tax=Salminus brasiliensis TaxID=930266 RepID=UPI003B82EE37